VKINALHAADFYKMDHRRQYPKGTSLVYSNLTPRSAKLKNIPDHLFSGKVTFFGLQHFIKSFLIQTWNETFFWQPKRFVIDRYKRRMNSSLGKDAIPTDHLEALHDLGYLPICIRALPEGTDVPIGVPCLTIHNSRHKPEFFWLTNYLETILSCSLWKATTAATVAKHYRTLLDRYAVETGTDPEFVQFQGHDFSFRGMSSIEDAAICDAGHLLSFAGTDTIPGIDLIEHYYNGDAEKELIGCSVPATEHSVMSMGGKEDEVDTFRRLLTETYPKGILSVVSDTWDLWRVVTNHVHSLRREILDRDGKLVIRPDSGDPVKIICGDPDSPIIERNLGVVGCLWNEFGGTITEKGYKLLDPHVGVIYGDSITLPRAEAILEGLWRKGFASGNVVLGIGSFTYQYCTRDTFGFAVKSTYGEVNGVGREIFKDPVTDDGTKRSLRGLISVRRVDGKLVAKDRATWEDQDDGEMRKVFEDGALLIDDSITEIRKRVRS
jgi:nicotinamide phosphoribosyltransferase